MSSVALQGNASGTGAFVIASPNSSSNRTLTLPDATDTLAGIAATQTLTNKTLTSPTITGAVVSTMASSVITSGTAVSTTSGTSIAFVGLPDWIKRITIMLNGVSTSGTSQVIAQLGTGAGPTYVTTGYVSGSNATTATNGLIIHGAGSAVDIRLGSCVLSNFGGNIWNSAASGGFGNGAGTENAGGYVSLGATLTAIRITTINGTDTFDAGSINILYE